MQSGNKRLKAEFFQLKKEQGGLLDLDWAVQTIIANQGEITGDAESLVFYAYCAKEQVWRIAKSCAQLYSKSKTNGNQREFAFAGFLYVDEWYTHVRDGRTVVVDTDMMTWDEFTSRANEMIESGTTETNHGLELLRFRDLKFGKHNDSLGKKA